MGNNHSLRQMFKNIDYFPTASGAHSFTLSKRGQLAKFPELLFKFQKDDKIKHILRTKIKKIKTTMILKNLRKTMGHGLYKYKFRTVDSRKKKENALGKIILENLLSKGYSVKTNINSDFSINWMISWRSPQPTSHTIFGRSNALRKHDLFFWKKRIQNMERKYNQLVSQNHH